MKKAALILVIFLLVWSRLASKPPDSNPPVSNPEDSNPQVLSGFMANNVDGKIHSGFYLSLSGGVAMELLTLKETFSYYYKTESNYAHHMGCGFMVDLKPGYAIGDYIILHGTLIYGTGFYMIFPGEASRLDGSPSFLKTYESFIGIGTTFFKKRKNMYYSFSLGSAGITVTPGWDDYYSGPQKIVGTRNFGGQFKFGKEWLAKRIDYGIGIGLNYFSAEGKDVFKGNMSAFSVFINANVSLK